MKNTNYKYQSHSILYRIENYNSNITFHLEYILNRQ